MAANTKVVLENLTDGYLAEASQIKGGFKVVTTAPSSAGRDTVIGSLCYCTADSKFYQYTESGWVEAKLGGTDVIANPTLTGHEAELSGITIGNTSYAVLAAVIDSSTSQIKSSLLPIWSGDVE